MPKKTKEGNIDLFYMDKVNGAERKKAPTKSKKKNEKLNMKNKKKQNKDDIFNFEDEIVIGISDKKTQEKNREQIKKEIKTKKNKKKKNNKKKNLVKFFVKWTSILLLLVGTIIFILTTPMFNIKNININGIEYLTEEQILSLSELNKNENIFKNSKSKISEKIKQNPYVESVIIKRALPDTLNINIKERKRSYMLNFVNGYVYIDTQGYILEISKNIITNIDISNKEDYTVYIESEKKMIHFGDISNLNNKILYVKAVIDSEKNIEGEIFVNGDLNNKFRPFFREKV